MKKIIALILSAVMLLTLVPAVMAAPTAEGVGGVAAGYTPEEITETKLLSPSAMEKAFGKKKAAELLDLGGVTRNPGSPTIAPESDKRQPYYSINDFKKLEE